LDTPSYAYGNLDTWMVVRLITTKYEPFMFPMLGFVFAYISNILIVLTLYDFYLLPAYFCYIAIDVRNLDDDTKSGSLLLTWPSNPRITVLAVLVSERFWLWDAGNGVRVEGRGGECRVLGAVGFGFVS